MKLFVLLPLSGADFLRATVGALVLAYGLCVLTMRYWVFYHLHTPVSWLGLLWFVLPIATLLGALCWLVTIVGLRRRFAAPLVGSWAGAVVVAVLYLALFGAELIRTREARSGEGPGAGDLGPFVRSLVRHR